MSLLQFSLARCWIRIPSAVVVATDHFAARSTAASIRLSKDVELELYLNRRVLRHCVHPFLPCELSPRAAGLLSTSMFDMDNFSVQARVDECVDAGPHSKLQRPGDLAAPSRSRTVESAPLWNASLPYHSHPRSRASEPWLRYAREISEVIALRRDSEFTQANNQRQMMFVSGETGDVSPETTSMIENIVQQQVMEMVYLPLNTCRKTGQLTRRASSNARQSSPAVEASVRSVQTI